jgi:hypothetical protein
MSEYEVTVKLTGKADTAQQAISNTLLRLEVTANFPHNKIEVLFVKKV